jgi:3-phosphoshikimate 1-carboxyvinyltransferase
MDAHATQTWGKGPAEHYAEIGKATAPLDVSVTLPGSKSITNRELLLAALADGRSVLTGPLLASDSWWMVDALKRLGVPVSLGTDAMTVAGGLLARPAEDTEIHVGSAGTAARFFPGVLAAVPGRVRVTASAQMSRRPVGDLVRALRALGAVIEGSGPDIALPLSVDGGTLEGGHVAMSGAVSSQFISGVLLAAPLARRPVEVEITDHIVQSAYVRITLDAMRRAGVAVDVSDDFRRFRVQPGRYRAYDRTLEADASTATYFMALAAVTGGRVHIANIGSDTLQPDFGLAGLLEQMGCDVTITPSTVTVARRGPLRGGQTFDMRPLSDATLSLAAVSVFADGPVSLRNVAHIRHHESDRIAVMCARLAEVGVRVEEHADGMTVHPGRIGHAVLDTADDHRVAMSLAVLAAGGGRLTLRDPGCVEKTCPDFFQRIEAIGVPVRLRD